MAHLIRFVSLALQVSGMTCSSCVRVIETALLSTLGVQKASVALTTKKCHVEFNSNQLGLRDVIAVIEVCVCMCVSIMLCLCVCMHTCVCSPTVERLPISGMNMRQVVEFFSKWYKVVLFLLYTSAQAASSHQIMHV